MYADLTEEITFDPLGRGYAGMSDAAVAADLEDASQARTALYPLDRAALNQWGASGAHARIQDVYNGATVPVDIPSGPTSEQIRSACIAAWRMLESANAELDLNNANHVTLLAVLAAGNDTVAPKSVITDAQHAALVAMATRSANC